MHAMISKTALFCVASVLMIGGAQASPIEDCNQSADVPRQIEGCSRFLQEDSLSPYVALAYGLRGGAYQKKGDRESAIADFSQAIGIDPRQVSVYVNRGLAYRDKGDLDRAIADFSKAIEIDSQSGEAFINRCVAYKDKGQYDLAMADCTNAIAINPNDAVAYNDLGVT